MPKGFTDSEKSAIHHALVNACKESWKQHGYKKTSVDELCRQAGISKGGFYIFFESKEALFCEVLCSAQKEIYKIASDAMEAEAGAAGIASALKLVYRAYDDHSFLYGSDTNDFLVLMSKVSEDQGKVLASLDESIKNMFLYPPSAKRKVDTEMAASVIYSLIMNIRNKDILPGDHIEVFDFMADHLVQTLYE